MAATAVCAALAVSACQYDRESRLAEIRSLQTSGQFEESIAPLRVLLTAASDHPEANYRLGVALVQTGRPSLAIWPLQKAAQSAEYRVQAGLLLSSTLLSTESYEEAVRAADAVLGAEPDRVAALYTRARANVGAGRPEDALVDAEYVLELRPDDAMGAALKVAALVDLERFDDAERTHLRLKQVAEESGDEDRSARACAVLARYHASRSDFDKASAHMLECFERYPTHALVQQYASDYFVETGDPSQAIEIWRKAVEHAPEDIGLRAKLADLLYESDRPEEAEAILVETVELFDTRPAWQMLGVHYRKVGKVTEAREAIEKALERSRQEPPALRFALADALISEGNYERAEQIANSMKEPSYRNMLRGSIRLAKGDPKGALKLLESGLRLWPNNAGARYVAGQAALQLGDIDRALSEYREAVRVSAESTDAALAMARIYFSLQKYKTAQQFAERHIKARPFETPDAHVIAIRSAARQRLWDRAESILENLNTKEDYRHVVVVEHAGVAREREGASAAIAVVERSEIDLKDPANVVVLTALARDLLDEGRGDDALARANEALAVAPKSAAFLDVQARLYARMGRDAEARKAVAKALEIDPAFGPVLEVAASYAERDGKREEALALLDRASESDPDNGDYAYRAAQLTFLLERDDDGIARLRKVVQISPGHVQASNDLAWRLAERDQDLDLALSLARRATQLGRGPDTLDTLGWVQFKRGDVDGAMRSFEQALKQQPDSPSVRYRLGLAQARKGDADSARENIARAVEMGSFPEAQAARAELARLESN